MRVQFQPTGKRVDVPRDVSLMAAARLAGIEINSICGGEGTCGQCQVIILRGDVSAPLADETLLLDAADLAAGRRLACCVYPKGDVVVEIPAESVTTGQRLQLESTLKDIPVDAVVRKHIVTLQKPSLKDNRSDFNRLIDMLQTSYVLPHLHAPVEVLRNIPETLRSHNWQVAVFSREDNLIGVGKADDRALGLCVDLGTTKIAAALLDLETGDILALRGAPNPQLGYGEDVISRINYVHRNPGGIETLAEKAQSVINQLLGELLADCAASRQQVVDGCIVGNTVMIHLLLRLPVRQLASAPYVAAISDAVYLPARDVGLEMASGASVYIPPCIGGFIGSDHLAMILACDLDRSEKISLGIDIGTNTEIVIRKPGAGLLGSASCASGPAFEGAHIGEGMRASSGAIERVAITGQGVNWATIQNEAPIGICGSGIIDAIAELYRTEFINRQGTFQRGNDRIRQGKNGSEFLLVPAPKSGTGRDIVIDQKDIGEIQLAKGAIHAGLQVLLNASNTRPEEIEEVFVAGAFGTILNMHHVQTIGLFPRLPNARFFQVGNAALVGARWMLISKTARRRALEIQRNTEYLELTTYPTFNRIFAHAMLFPEQNKEEAD